MFTALPQGPDFTAAVAQRVARRALNRAAVEAYREIMAAEPEVSRILDDEWIRRAAQALRECEDLARFVPNLAAALRCRQDQRQEEVYG